MSKVYIIICSICIGFNLGLAFTNYMNKGVHSSLFKINIATAVIMMLSLVLQCYVENRVF